MSGLSLARQAARALRREWRSGELRVLALALLVSVTSVSGVGFFTDRMERAMDAGAADLLGADLLLYSTRDSDPGYADAARERGLSVASTSTLRSVVVARERMQLVSLKAVSPGYPLRGTVLTAARPYAPAQPAPGIPATGTAWADARLMAMLGVAVGDEVQVGRLRLVVEQVLAHEPDRGGELFSIAPRLMMNRDDLAGTALVAPGSRVKNRLLVAGPETAVAAYRTWLATRISADEEIQGVRDARPEIRVALERGGSFLGLSALVAVLLSGVAIAMSARQFASRHMDAAALLRCLGASRGQVLGIYALQLVMLAAVACGLGVALGWLAQQLLSQALSQMMFARLPTASLQPALAGVSIGLTALLGFALPPILALSRVPPARVLRRELGGLHARGLAARVLAAATVIGLVLWQARDLTLALYVVGGGAVAVAVLILLAWLAVRALSGARARVGVSWRFGIANLLRRAMSSTVQVAAFGLGLSMLILLTLVREDLLGQWQSSLPEDAPNYFLVNIQRDEVAGVEGLLASRNLHGTALHPMIRGRLVARNGQPLRQEDYDNPRAQRLLAREFNLSSAASLRADNRVVAGRMWSAGAPRAGELSVEKGLADTLGLALGDRLQFQIAGVQTEATITSLREVDWDSFKVNFFVVASPGTLDDAPATWITAFHLPADQRDALVELVRAHPTVTVVDVDALLSKVREIMRRASDGIELVFAFTLLAGLTVLYAAVQATLDERRYETAVLRTLGAGRSTLFKGLVAEFLALGALAGLLASALSVGLGAIVAQQILDISYTPAAGVWLVGPLLGALGVTVAGILGTRRVISAPPLATLRTAPPAG
jgi:putative ABC transport system permease protein